MFEFIWGYVGAASVLLVCLFALAKGEEGERIGGGALLMSWFLSVVAQRTLGYLATPWPIFLIDLVLLAVFVSLVWKSSRSWPVWASALQLLCVASHSMVLMKLRPEVSAFYTVVNMAGYGILVALGVGTFLIWQERRAAGLEQS